MKNKNIGFLNKGNTIETKNGYALVLVKYNDGEQKDLKYKLHVCDKDTGYSVDAGLIYKPSEQKKLRAYVTDCLLGFNDDEIEKKIAEINQQIKGNTVPEMNVKVKHSIMDIYRHVCDWVSNPENANAIHRDDEGYYYILADRLREVVKEYCNRDLLKELYKFFASNGLYEHDDGRNTLHVNANKRLGIKKQAHYVVFYNIYEMEKTA